MLWAWVSSPMSRSKLKVTREAGDMAGSTPTSRSPAATGWRRGLRCTCRFRAAPVRCGRSACGRGSGTSCGACSTRPGRVRGSCRWPVGTASRRCGCPGALRLVRGTGAGRAGAGGGVGPAAGRDRVRPGGADIGPVPAARGSVAGVRRPHRRVEHGQQHEDPSFGAGCAWDPSLLVVDESAYVTTTCGRRSRRGGKAGELPDTADLDTGAWQQANPRARLYTATRCGRC